MFEPELPRESGIWEAVKPFLTANPMAIPGGWVGDKAEH